MNKILIDRAVVEQALEALAVVINDDYNLPYSKIVAAAEALRAALREQPASEPVAWTEQREQDRKRFPDPAFNRWLDEGISDCGHTVWDLIGDTNAAWHGWDNRQYYAPPPEIERLRKAARMALEALESLQGGCTDSDDGTVEAITVYCPEVIIALRAALGDKNE